MREAIANCFEYTENGRAPDAICIHTNMTVRRGELIMGGGQAAEARDRYSFLPKVWGQSYDANPGSGNPDKYQELRSSPIRVHTVLHPPGSGVDAESGDVEYTPGRPPLQLVSYPTKVNPGYSSELSLIYRGALDLSHVADAWGWTLVVMGQPGCGLGGLEWDHVRTIISPVLDDRFVALTLPPRQ